MDWREAEIAAAVWMQGHGFPDAALTPPGADGGVDITARSAVAQVKAHWRPVGRPSLQNLFGISKAEQRAALFFSTSGFTPEAIQWAGRVGVALLLLHETGEVSALNRHAEGLTVNNLEPTPSRRVQTLTFRLDRSLTTHELEAQWLAETRSWTTDRISPSLRRARRTVVHLLETLEETSAASDCKLGFTSGVLVVTNRRLLFVGTNRSVRSWPLHDVYRCEVELRGRYARFTFVSGGERWLLKNLRPQTAYVLAETLPGSHSLPDPAEQLAKARQRAQEKETAAHDRAAAKDAARTRREAGRVDAKQRQHERAERKRSEREAARRATSPPPVPPEPDLLQPHLTCRADAFSVSGPNGGHLPVVRSWARIRGYLAAVLVGALALGVVGSIAESIWGPWQNDVLPTPVALAEWTAGIAAGVSWFRWRRSRSDRSANSP